MVTQRYVEHYFNTIRIDGYVTGAAQPKLTQQALNKIPIPIPRDLRAQEQVVSTIDRFRQEIERLESVFSLKEATLESLRGSLLSEAFSGRQTA